MPDSVLQDRKDALTALLPFRLSDLRIMLVPLTGEPHNAKLRRFDGRGGPGVWN
jgi:hypothetical protein